ncbi:MAG: hypothetical protein KDB10_20960 [Acidimicrobiales bacterium]|nr:hypothetical protein [Acidimicrobiales bacterium]
MTLVLSLLVAGSGAVLRYVVAAGADPVDGLGLAALGLLLMAAGAMGAVLGSFQLAGRRGSDVAGPRPVEPPP